MLKIATLASGSSGNCAVVSDGHTHILLDAGISAKRIITGLRELGLEPGKVSAILITHEHSDHICGLPVLSRQLNAEIYATEPTALQICGKVKGLEEKFRVFDPGDRFALGTMQAGSFATSHDCACPVGYVVTEGVRRLALCTDTGVVTDPMRKVIAGANTLVGEFNYDPDMLREGPYPVYLKERILSDRGHLSNEAGSRLAVWAAEQGADRVIMAHLSKENNLPSLAMKAARQALDAAGACDTAVVAAPRSECSGWMEV